MYKIPLLFVLITNLIIKKIMESQLGFRNNKFCIPVLFYANDGLILSNNRKEMPQVKSLMMEVSAEH